MVMLAVEPARPASARSSRTVDRDLRAAAPARGGGGRQRRIAPIRSRTAAWSAARRRRRTTIRQSAWRRQSSVTPSPSGRRGRARTRSISQRANHSGSSWSDSAPNIWTWAPMRPSAPRQQHGETRRRHVGAARQQREGARLAAALGRPHGIAHGDVAHQRRQHLGMERRQSVEAAAGEPPHFAVAQRRDAARALAVRQQRHLAHDVAGRDLGHQDRLVGTVLLLVPEHAQAAAGHDIDGVGRLALANKGAPPGSTSSDSSRSMAAMLFSSRSANRGARWSALRSRSRRGVLARRDDAHPSLLIFRACP